MENNYENIQHNSEVVTVKEWLICLLIMLIPLVNIVMIFVWAFGGNTKKSISNFYKANIIFLAVNLVIMGILWGTLLIGLMSSF